MNIEGFLRRLYNSQNQRNQGLLPDSSREALLLDDLDNAPPDFLRDPKVTKEYLDRLQAQEWRRGL